MLSRHVNQHFSATEDKNGSSESGKNVAKKSTSKANGVGGGSAAAGSMCPYTSANLSPLDKVKADKNNKSSKDTLYLARKSACHFPSTKKFSSSTKNLKRAGIRLKFRQGGVFSARNFDFFDPSVMPGLRHAVYDLQTKSFKAGLDGDQCVNFAGKVVAVKANKKCNSNKNSKSALVRWSPENL